MRVRCRRRIRARTASPYSTSRRNKVVRTIEGGSDPENFVVSKDGKWIYVSNEDDDGVSIIDLTSGKVVPPTIKNRRPA